MVWAYGGAVTVERKIEPALSADEWARFLSPTDQEIRPGIGALPGADFELIGFIGETDRDALAALCLYGQPFGFEHWMIEWLHERSWSCVPEEVEAACRDEGDVDVLIADRISALLPPRTEEE
jgi:hypothetical protein